MPTTAGARPSPAPVVHNVWRIRGVRGANVYAVRRADGSGVLIDCGLPGSVDAVIEGVRALDLAPVTHLLLTHRHPDHAGAAAAVHEAFGAQVVVGAGDVVDGHVGLDQARRRLRERVRRFQPGEPAAVHVVLPPEEEVEVLPGMLAIPAPGHTMGSTVYVLAEADVWFIGDLSLHSGDRMSRPLPISNDDTEAQERSLRRIAERAGENGAPGHGDPVVGGFGEMLRTLADRPPAPGPWWLRVVLNPLAMWRFMRRSRAD